MTRAASAFEKQGYLEKDRHGANWRVAKLVPADKARAFVDEVTKQASASIERSLSILSEEEREELTECSNRASALLETAIERIEG